MVREEGVGRGGEEAKVIHFVHTRSVLCIIGAPSSNPAHNPIHITIHVLHSVARDLVNCEERAYGC